MRRSRTPADALVILLCALAVTTTACRSEPTVDAGAVGDDQQVEQLDALLDDIDSDLDALDADLDLD
jgi:hypothetical protein